MSQNLIQTLSSLPQWLFTAVFPKPQLSSYKQDYIIKLPCGLRVCTEAQNRLWHITGAQHMFTHLLTYETGDVLFLPQLKNLFDFKYHWTVVFVCVCSMVMIPILHQRILWGLNGMVWEKHVNNCEGLNCEGKNQLHRGLV